MVAMRGFVLDTSNSYQRDGYKFFGTGGGDTADIEEVQVLKGPASAVYGASEAGGVVNIITKKPTSTPFYSVTMTGGSFGFLRPEFDVSGPVNHNGTLFYRLSGVYQDADSFRDYVFSKKWFAAPYLLWKPSPATSLAVQGEFLNVNSMDDYGVPVYGDRPAPVPVSTQYTEPWSRVWNRDRQVGYRFNHTFASGWNLYNGFQLAQPMRLIQMPPQGANDLADPTMVTRNSAAGLAFPNIYRYLQTSLTGSVKTGGATHHIAVGFEAGWVTASSLGPIGYAPDVSILNPQLGLFSEADALTALQNPFFTLNGTTFVQNQSLYAQDQIDLGRHWKAIGGLRVERYYQDSVNNGSHSHLTSTEFPVSPRFGLVYQPREWLSIYGSYVRSFVPVDPSAVNWERRQFQPGRDHQWEAGVKVASLSGRMSSTIALFQIEKNNVIEPDPTNPLFSIQDGQQRSKGAEFEFRGSPVSGLNLLTSYAYTLARMTDSTQYAVGNILPNAPKNSGAVWASYQAPSGALRNLRLSAGVLATSARQDNYYNTALLPGYARLDVGMAYDLHIRERQKIRFSANVQNALDRVYYLASNGQNQARPGSPHCRTGVPTMEPILTRWLKLFSLSFVLIASVLSSCLSVRAKAVHSLRIVTGAF